MVQMGNSADFGRITLLSVMPTADHCDRRRNMADAPQQVTAPAPPSSGLAIYVAENGGNLDCPVLLLIDEDDDYKMIDVFVSEWDINNAYTHDNWFSWPNNRPPNGDSFRTRIDAGELTRIGSMPRKHVFYRRA
jgi:hypothetical protein